MPVNARVVILAILIALILAACGDGSDSVSPGSGVTSVGSDGASVDIDSFDVEEPAAEPDGQLIDEGRQLAVGGFDRRVIRSADLTLDVTDVPRAVRHARSVAEEYGGYVESSSARTFGDDDEIAELTLEVPSSEFDPVLDALRDSPHVTRVVHESTSSRDVTEEYVDLRSRLTNLEATEARFVSLLDEATTINDILSVEREISRVRGEIEQIQGRINYLEQRTDFSRIHVEFRPEASPVAIAGWQFTPGETAREAWNASMRFLGTFANAAITVAVFFWWAWPLLAIAIGLIWRYQRRRVRDRAEPIQA